MSSPPLNFYDTLRAQVRLAVYLDVGPEYARQIHALIGIFAVSMVVAVAALFLKWRSGTAWLFRMRSTNAGPFVTPNPIVCWLLGSVVFLALALGPYSQLSLKVGDKYNAPDVYNNHLYVYAVWIPLVLGAWFMAHATFLTPILSDPSSRLAQHPVLINAFFLITPLLMLGTMIPLIVQGSIDYNDSELLFNQIDSFLTSASATTNAGGTVDIAFITPVLLAAKATIEENALSFRRVWIGWSGMVGLLFIVFIVAFVKNYRSLGKTLKSVRSHHATSGGSSAQSQSESAVLSAYRALIFTVVSVLSICGSYLGLAIYLAANTFQIQSSGNHAAADVVLISMWLFGILGTTANVGILVRSFAPPPPTPSRLGQTTDRQFVMVPHQEFQWQPEFATATMEKEHHEVHEMGGPVESKEQPDVDYRI